MPKVNRITCKPPFTGEFAFKRNLVHGRMGVRIYEENGNKITMNYSRYLMCVKENRILKTSEEVHHKNLDKGNDNIDNLEIISNNEHRALHRPHLLYVRLQCPNCLKEFDRRGYRYKENDKNNCEFVACSKSCSRSMSIGLSKIKLTTIK